MERLSLFVSDLLIIEIIIALLFFTYDFLNNNTDLFFYYKTRRLIVKIKNLLSTNSKEVLFVFIVYTLLVKSFIMFCNYKW